MGTASQAGMTKLSEMTSKERLVLRLAKGRADARARRDAETHVATARHDDLSVDTVNGPLCPTCAASVRDDEPENIIGTCAASNGCYNCEDR